jgi:hypothetical protein
MGEASAIDLPDVESEIFLILGLGKTSDNQK